LKPIEAAFFLLGGVKGFISNHRNEQLIPMNEHIFQMLGSSTNSPK
jgi:hypothetical protein